MFEHRPANSDVAAIDLAHRGGVLGDDRHSPWLQLAGPLERCEGHTAKLQEGDQGRGLHSQLFVLGQSGHALNCRALLDVERGGSLQSTQASTHEVEDRIGLEHTSNFRKVLSKINMKRGEL